MDANARIEFFAAKLEENNAAATKIAGQLLVAHPAIYVIRIDKLFAQLEFDGDIRVGAKVKRAGVGGIQGATQLSKANAENIAPELKNGNEVVGVAMPLAKALEFALSEINGLNEFYNDLIAEAKKEL